MRSVYRFLTALLALVLCLSFASCELFPLPKNTEENTSPFSTEPETTPEETTPEETTPEETTPEETTPTVTEPDFSNTPDPDGTKRY